MESIFFTASFTLIGGCLLYCINQIVSKLVIEPYVSYRAVLGDITYKLATDYSFIVSARHEDSPEKHTEVARGVKDMAAKLRSTIASCPCRWFLRALRLIPSRKVMLEATGLLNRISHRLVEPKKQNDTIYEDVRCMAKLLGIELAGD